MIRLPQDAGLIIIDVQKGFDDPKWGPVTTPTPNRKLRLCLRRGVERGDLYFTYSICRTLRVLL
jgi:hypothetical protein